MKADRVNLIPLDLRPKLQLPPAALPLVLAGLGTLHLAISVPWYSIQISHRSTELEQLTRTRDELAAEIKKGSDELKIREKSEESLAKLQRLIERRRSWSELFEALSQVTPEGVWLTSLSKGGTAATPGIVIRGQTSSNRRVAQYLDKLEHSAAFGKVVLTSSELEAGVSPSRYRFELSVPLDDNGGGG